MTPANPSISNEYNAALSGAAYFPLTEAGYMRIGGADRQIFMQRQTTNDVRLLSPGHALVTVLTSPTARILDVLTLVPEVDSIGAITLPGHAGDTFNYLRSRVFFMDKVTVEDASAGFLQLDLVGPGILSVLRNLGSTKPVEPGQAQSLEVAGSPVWAIQTAELGFRLLVPADLVEPVIAALEETGAVRLSPETHTILRVESGRPGAGAELVEEYTPLETGLESSISDEKGCYTGQEVLARQVTYDKVTRHLAGLVLEGEVYPGDPVWSLEEERSAGTVTSVANSPRFGHIALAILRRPHHIPGNVLRVGGRENAIRASVTGLPFENRGAQV
jgi:folate-binding protein YgfZ